MRAIRQLGSGSRLDGRQQKSIYWRPSNCPRDGSLGLRSGASHFAAILVSHDVKVTDRKVGHTPNKDMSWRSHVLFYLCPLSVILTVGFLVRVFPHFSRAPFWICLAAIIVTVVVAAFTGKRLVADVNNLRQTGLTLFAYLVGVGVAGLFRGTEGRLHFCHFYDEAIPLVAGFVVAIVFQQSKRISGNCDDLRAREFTVVYMLAGAVSSLFGLFVGTGFIYLAFFLALVGSLGSSCYALVRAALVQGPD
jgi:hypothetical protein